MSLEILDRKKIGNNELVLYLWDNLDDRTVPRLWENVEYFSSDGEKIWTVNGMSQCEFWGTHYGKDDFFVGIGHDGENWVLNSYSGNLYNLDISTGRVTYASFHK